MLFMFLFARECKEDRTRHSEQEGLSNEHVVLEIERFRKEKVMK